MSPTKTKSASLGNIFGHGRPSVHFVAWSRSLYMRALMFISSSVTIGSNGTVPALLCDILLHVTCRAMSMNRHVRPRPALQLLTEPGKQLQEVTTKGVAFSFRFPELSTQSPPPRLLPILPGLPAHDKLSAAAHFSKAEASFAQSCQLNTASQSGCCCLESRQLLKFYNRFYNHARRYMPLP